MCVCTMSFAVLLLEIYSCPALISASSELSSTKGNDEASLLMCFRVFIFICMYVFVTGAGPVTT